LSHSRKGIIVAFPAPTLELFEESLLGNDRIGFAAGSTEALPLTYMEGAFEPYLQECAPRSNCA